jgi:hypothetical protein
MDKLPYIHEINTFWRAISIHRWTTVLLLQQCNNYEVTLVKLLMVAGNEIISQIFPFFANDERNIPYYIAFNRTTPIAFSTVLWDAA